MAVTHGLWHQVPRAQAGGLLGPRRGAAHVRLGEEPGQSPLVPACRMPLAIAQPRRGQRSGRRTPGEGTISAPTNAQPPVSILAAGAGSRPGGGLRARRQHRPDVHAAWRPRRPEASLSLPLELSPAACRSGRHHATSSAPKAEWHTRGHGTKAFRHFRSCISIDVLSFALQRASFFIFKWYSETGSELVSGHPRVLGKEKA